MKIGIDIGGSHIASGIVLEDGKLLAKETKDINFFYDVIDKLNIDEKEEYSKRKMIEVIDEEISKLLESNNFTKEDISFIGIAAPGNPGKKTIRNLVNLGITEFKIATILENKYNAEVRIKNDGKCAGIAEKTYGSLQKYNDAVFLCMGTGVGSAAFLNGKLLEPTRATGFELGHMIMEKDGIECKCGKKGCFETYASMKRFKKTAISKLKLDENLESGEIQKYIRENINQKDVQELVDEYLENVAIGISNIINIFEPEAISFGGSFSYYEDIFLPILSEKIKKYIFNKEIEHKLISAQLKNDAGIIGAVLI